MLHNKSSKILFFMFFFTTNHFINRSINGIKTIEKWEKNDTEVDNFDFVNVFSNKTKASKYADIETSHIHS